MSVTNTDLTTTSPNPAPAPSTSKIRLYAELLLNIRSVTLHASLQSNHTRETKATLAADGQTVTLTHEDASGSIVLPTKIPQGKGGDAALVLPESPPAKELSLRLRLDEREGGEEPKKLLPEASAAENRVPWGAEALGEGPVGVACGTCGQAVLEKGKVGDWRDLPSENWAEMMEFWHCHKPNEPEHEKAGEDKPYAANKKLSAVEGVGFVDLGSFLLAEGDCVNLKLSPAAKESKDRRISDDELQCTNCEQCIGFVDDRTEGWRIYKWAVKVAIGDQAPLSYTQQKWISAQLLSVVEYQGVRKFVVTDQADNGEAADEGMLLWVFTPDLHFSSSVDIDRRNDPTRAMKVFWQKAPEDMKRDDLLTSQNLSVEEMALPSQLFKALKAALRDSPDLLPSSARNFQEWDVGLLERFADDET